LPETAWRVTNHRQATHANSCILGSWKRNRLAAYSRPPGDPRRLSHFLGLLMKRLAGLVDPPGGTGQSGSFLGLLGFWVKSDRGKSPW